MNDPQARPATRIDTGPPPPQASSGRVCSKSGCRTVLSIYNSRKRCSVHDFWEGSGGPRAKWSGAVS